jgi:uncharacterized protein (TIGR00369 family)
VTGGPLPPATPFDMKLGSPQGPLAFVPREEADGRVVWEYTVSAAHYNPYGVLHGGVVMALLDTAMGHAVAELVAPEGAFNAAAEMSVRFLEPIRSGTITARAEVRKCGKRLAVVEAEATDEHGLTLAVATATHAILRKKKELPAPAPDHS